MDNMHTKEKLRIVLKTFDPPYLHVGATKVAVIANTGTLSEDEQIEIAQRLVKCWNEYDDLVEVIELANTAIGHILEISNEGDKVLCVGERIKFELEQALKGNRDE